MNNSLLQIKITQRLNKLSSKDYDNLEPWMIQEAFNKAQLEWTRRQIYGLHTRREGSEQSTGLVDDLQILLRSQILTGTNKPEFFEAVLPDDYLYYVRTDVNAKTECCGNRRMTVYQVEEANIGILVDHEHYKPSFEWAETLVTLLGNSLRVYTMGEFEVTTCNLVYYKKPTPIAILGSVDPSTDTPITTEVISIFKDDVLEVIIDDAAAILAGDLESMNQYQREVQNVQKNS